MLPSHHLLSIYPALCGVMAFNITLTMQDLGLQYSSSWKAITAVAHIYNASRQSGLRLKLWPDMETFLAIHPNTFSGDRPVTPQGFHLDVVKAFAEIYIPHHILSKTKRRKAEKLGIRATYTISSIFINRYTFKSDSEPYVQITLRDIESLLNLSASRENISNSSSQPDPKRAKPGGKAERNKHAREMASRAALVKQVEESKRFGPLELLETLCLSLVAELIPALTFNYLGMHIRCMNILRGIHRRLQPWVKRERPDLAGSDPPGDMLPVFAIMILGRHADTTTTLEDPFQQACEALNTYIEIEGSVENDRMAELDAAWFGKLEGQRRVKWDVKTEANALIEALASGTDGAKLYIAHYKKWQQEWIPFENLYSALNEEKKQKEMADAKSANASGEAEKTRKKRKRTKKKKKKKATRSGELEDNRGEDADDEQNGEGDSESDA